MRFYCAAICVASLLLILTARASARFGPSAKAIAHCAAIGKSSGCSGCENPSTGCQWCRRPGDDTFIAPCGSNCAPLGFCDSIVEPSGRDWEYEPGGQLCSGDLANTLRYLEVPKNGNLADQEWRNGHFSDHYCDFSNEVQTVDRFNRVFGDAEGACRSVNNILAAGSRADLLKCTGKESFSKKDDACIELYQSLLCTTRCWSYGEPVAFDETCHNVCDRLGQYCSDVDLNAIDVSGKKTLFECLDEAEPLINFQCLEESDKDCYDPKLIGASARFKDELCLNGDTTDCPVAIDCEMEKLGSFPDNIAEFGIYVAFRSSFSRSPPAAYADIRTVFPTVSIANEPVSPCINVSPPRTYQDGLNTVTKYFVSISYAFEVTKKPTPTGLSCSKVLESEMSTIAANETPALLASSPKTVETANSIKDMLGCFDFILSDGTKKPLCIARIEFSSVTAYPPFLADVLPNCPSYAYPDPSEIVPS